MKPVHIIGHAGCGKTTLIVDLIKEFTKRNVPVGTIKHSSHAHELDKPGKDSFCHRKAGATPAAMVTKDMAAVYLPGTWADTPDKLIKTYFTHVDIVLIEGWISGPYCKIEVWRDIVNQSPLFSALSGVKAIVSDDEFPIDIEKNIELSGIDSMKRRDVGKLADFVMELTMGQTRT